MGLQQNGSRSRTPLGPCRHTNTVPPTYSTTATKDVTTVQLLCPDARFNLSISLSTGARHSHPSQSIRAGHVISRYRDLSGQPRTGFSPTQGLATGLQLWIATLGTYLGTADIRKDRLQPASQMPGPILMSQQRERQVTAQTCIVLHWRKPKSPPFFNKVFFGANTGPAFQLLRVKDTTEESSLPPPTELQKTTQLHPDTADVQQRS